MLEKATLLGFPTRANMACHRQTTILRSVFVKVSKVGPDGPHGRENLEMHLWCRNLHKQRM